MHKIIGTNATVIFSPEADAVELEWDNNLLINFFRNTTSTAVTPSE
jgi:hypothetical protein